ncbi:hypothetical protein BQ06000 [Bartonella quintana str. Toulouse]|uniref:Uncharacterized protein n=1 Tax=Bartonella quintana (strain Toulouse) TaxID=283165 RepID=A0A0H3LU27_BARQU|nr:hypothetical protein BQ06000 [Bartonella quintana str. Toulouse]
MTEHASLKVRVDEIFNFVNCHLAKEICSTKCYRVVFLDNHNFVMVYAKDKTVWGPNLLPRSTAKEF